MKCSNILLTANCQSALQQFESLNLPQPTSYQLSDFQLYYAHTIEEAAIFLTQQSFDLILLSLDFNQTNCYQSLNQLVSAAPRSPVVVVCDPNAEDQASVSLEHGAVDYFTTQDNSAKFIARIFRYALDSKQKIERALESSNIDPLTGLANRSGFIAFIKRQLREAERL